MLFDSFVRVLLGFLTAATKPAGGWEWLSSSLVDKV
jgi:hypothetical protein